MLLELIQPDIYVLLELLRPLKTLSSSGVTLSKSKPHSQTLKRIKQHIISLEMLNFAKSILVHLL